MYVGGCDIIRCNAYHEELSHRRQRNSLDVCTQMKPSMCLKNRTVLQTAVDVNFRVPTQGEVGSANLMEVLTLAIDRECEEADRCILSDYTLGAFAFD